MSDHVTPPHLTDHGEHDLPDDSHTTPTAKILFGWTAKPWTGRLLFWLLAAVSLVLIGLEPLLAASSARCASPHGAAASG